MRRLSGNHAKLVLAQPAKTNGRLFRTLWKGIRKESVSKSAVVQLFSDELVEDSDEIQSGNASDKVLTENACISEVEESNIAKQSAKKRNDHELNRGSREGRKAKPAMDHHFDIDACKKAGGNKLTPPDDYTECTDSDFTS